MYLTLKSGDGKFDEFKTKLVARMTARMANAGDVSLPTFLSALSQPACEDFVASDTYPNEITKIAFGFKADADPAGQFPLRGLKLTTKNAGDTSVGTVISNPGTFDKGVSTLEVFDLAGVTSIDSIITYYCENAKNSHDQRYGRRLVAVYIRYSKGSDSGSVLLAGVGSLFKKAVSEASNSDKWLDAIEAAVNKFNSNSGYRISSEIRDHVVPISFKWGTNQITRRLANVGFSSFRGRSTSYINNFSLIFASETKNEFATLLAAVTKFTISAGFVPNALNQDTKVTLSGGREKLARAVTISEKSSTTTLKIPGIEIGSVLKIESPLQYSETEKDSDQREMSDTNKRSMSIEMTVPGSSYVVRGFPAPGNYSGETVIGLYSATDTNEPDHQIVIPTDTPCIVANDDNDLAKRLLDFI
ncbi:MAG: hypothetical protein HWE23_00355 [Rhodobacteraceae bacterium]|nr:hypothetical protein [Paracoccaceae bacterium]